VVKEAVGNGRLVGAEAPAALRAVADRYGVGPDAVAIGAVLAQPWCDVVLSGAVTPDQLASNAAAVSFDPDELAELTEPPDRYWATRSRRPWA
jgi:aryl-alcohol dehydrogenase-like predicted oxidoreductase